MIDTKEEFLESVEKTDSCWVWKGYIRNDGYGQAVFRKKTWSAHRLAWMGPMIQDIGTPRRSHFKSRLCVAGIDRHASGRTMNAEQAIQCSIAGC